MLSTRHALAAVALAELVLADCSTSRPALGVYPAARPAVSAATSGCAVPPPVRGGRAETKAQG